MARIHPVHTVARREGGREGGRGREGGGRDILSHSVLFMHQKGLTTYHTLKVTVKGLHNVVDEFQNAELVLGGSVQHDCTHRSRLQ